MGKTLARLLLFLLLFAFWFGLSGQTDPFLLGYGVVACGGVVVFLVRWKATIWGWSPLALAAATGLYVPWLLLEILKANLRVLYLTLHPKLPIDPCLVRVPCTLRTPLGRAIYANSITLTPGTVSVALEDDAILVHAITREDGEGLLDGAMHDRIARLEQLA